MSTRTTRAGPPPVDDSRTFSTAVVEGGVKQSVARQGHGLRGRGGRMSTYSHTVRIGRPLEEVFAFVTDPVAYPRWQPSLVRVEPHRPGPLPLGSEATRSAIECDQGPVPFRGTFELEPAGGGTLFTWTVETWGAAARLGGPLAGLATRRELAANAGRLKELLEGERFACPNK